MIAAAEGREAVVIEGDPYETAGVNSRAELAQLELEWQRRRREQALRRRRDPDRPGKRVVRLRHQARPRRDGRAARRLRPRRVESPTARPSTPSAISRARRSARGAASARSRGSGPGTAARREAPRSAISSRSRRPTSARAPRSIICPMSATPRSARGANIGAGTITCNYDGFGKYRTDDRRGRLHRLEHRAGRAGHDRRRARSSAPARSSPATSRPTASRSRAASRRASPAGPSASASGMTPESEAARQ